MLKHLSIDLQHLFSNYDNRSSIGRNQNQNSNANASEKITKFKSFQ